MTNFTIGFNRFRPWRHQFPTPTPPWRYKSRPTNSSYGQQPTAVPVPHAQVLAARPGPEAGPGECVHRWLRKGTCCSGEATGSQGHTTQTYQRKKCKDSSGKRAFHSQTRHRWPRHIVLYGHLDFESAVTAQNDDEFTAVFKARLLVR